MEDVVICSYARTPIGKFGGLLSRYKAPELGAFAIKACLERSGAGVEDVDEVLMGQVLQAGVGQNPARQAALKAGCPGTVAATTINKVCGSGLKSVMLATQALKCGDQDVVVAGGMESMSNAPYLLPQARFGQRLGHAQVIDAMIQDGLWCAHEDWHMGSAADHIAQAHDISREDQDRFSAQSQSRAAQATEEGRFKPEIVPITIPQRKGDPIVMETDEGIRGQTTAEDLGKLRPVFSKEGCVTAGNASTLSDGASALLLTRKSIAEGRGWPIKATVCEQAVGGVEPKEIFWAPVIAVQKLLKKANLELSQIDLIEANEAFAAQVLADGKGLGGIDESKLNIWGGAIALGHPIGSSGARVLCTLLNALEQLDKKTGIATLCLGGGNAVALRVER